MAIAFAVIVVVIMVVPSTLPAVVGCVPPRNQNPAAQGEKATLTIHAPNAAIASVAARLLPNQRVIVGAAAAGGDPAYWKPTADEIRAIQSGGERFDILSMGMSGDYEVAIECGANLVRVGSAIFGDPKPGMEEQEEE